MNCPRCGTGLIKKYYKGMIEVDACPNCLGMWLDANELDQLEDMHFSDDAHKGSLIHSQKKSTTPCPKCGSAMNEFQYRLYDLRLDYCVDNGDGFWLDAGEDERVMEIMKNRDKDIHRQMNAEREWGQMLKDMHAFLSRKSKR